MDARAARSRYATRRGEGDEERAGDREGIIKIYRNVFKMDWVRRMRQINFNALSKRYTLYRIKTIIKLYSYTGIRYGMI